MDFLGPRMRARNGTCRRLGIKWTLVWLIVACATVGLLAEGEMQAGYVEIRSPTGSETGFKSFVSNPNWNSQTTALVPSVMDYASSSYEDHADVDFGGYNGWSYLDDTYGWTGTSQSAWTNLTGYLTSAPSAREGAAMAQVETTDQAVLFGGYSGSSYLNDTWVFNGGAGTSGNWAEPAANDSGPHHFLRCDDAAGNQIACPAARAGAIIVDDVNDGYDLMFGGESGTTTYYQDTWKFYYNSTGCLGPGVYGWCATWVEICASCGPQATAWAGGAYDASSHDVVMFGGYYLSTVTGHQVPTLTDDSCTFTGGAWGTCGALTGPSARAAWGDFTYDPYSSSDGAILFGGLASSGSQSDTWLYSSGTWTSESPTTTPSARQYAAVVYDDFDTPTAVLMFGGYDTATSSYLQDTWLWN